LERTLVLLKPDCLQRGLVGRIIDRFETKGLKLVGLKLRVFPEELLRKHYADHKAKPFFAGLVRFMGSGPAVALALEGKNAIAVTRALMGTTDCGKAAPGTIRGDFGLSFSYNLVHGSDSPAAAERELALFFPSAEELVAWTPAGEGWVYNVEEELPSSPPPTSPPRKSPSRARPRAKAGSTTSRKS
jgi:nucleoside-diphosphate kinase